MSPLAPASRQRAAHRTGGPLYKPVPPKVHFPTLEHDILRFWEERRIFEQLRARNKGHDRFSFIDGPITANNPMGVHHAWGRTYKDIYQRYKAMQGFDQRYQNGFDCQGLWVEVEVEKALGLNSKREIEEYGLDRFAERCRERVLTYAETITKQSKRLGQWMDWDHSYYTMDDNNIEHIWYFLQRCHERGWLYKGWRTMPWCVRCGTSLSQHELIGTDSYREVTHPSVYIKLPIVDRPGEYFLVWTTTPWTLPANVALAVHPDLDYARVSVGDETYYLGAKLVPELFGTGQLPDEILKGAALVGWRYVGPFADVPAQAEVRHRVVAWTDVGEEEGTGIVHIAPGCGAEDFDVGQREGLAVIVPIDDNGDFHPGFGPLSGLNVHDVRPAVFAWLEARGMLFKVAEIEHRYPTCWRCGQEIVFRAVSEWFLSAEALRPRLLAAARSVEWTPAFAGKRMEDWLKNMGDWCISRKRYWGLPLPFYPCEGCGKLNVIGSVAELHERAVSGLEQLRELHRPWIDAVRIQCADCGAVSERITEVGDCWLDAGIVPFSTLGPGYLKDREEWAKWYPADWVSEMREQIRLWFYSMLFMSVALEDRSPYKRVLTYEKLMDETGRPMHKSLGNAIWFDEAAEKMGADVMRWLYAGQNIQSNLLFGYGPAEEVHRKLLTLWNVYSFYVTYAEIEEFTPAAAPRDLPRSAMDRWILSQLQLLVAYANERLDAYDVAALVERVDRFADDLSTWYLRRGRRRFARTAEPNDRLAAFATLAECLVTLARLIAPIMPFLAEELYQNLVRSWDSSAPESIHLTPYPQPDRSLVDEALNREMELARAIVALGRAARSEAGIRVRQPLPRLTIAAERADLMLSEELRREIADELNVKRVELVDNIEAFAQRVVRPNPRLLGPRLGSRFPEVNRALQAGQYAIHPDGTVHVLDQVLTPEEVAVSLQPLENQAVAQDVQFQGGLAVSLDKSITPELLGEGRVRELIHRVQMMRRDAGLNVEDRIELGYAASSALASLIEAFRDRIRDEVGAIDVSDRAQVASGRDEVTVWSGTLDGENVTLTLRQVS